MKLLDEIPKKPLTLQRPVALTIGTFDGLHLGHQAILHRLKYLTKEKGASGVITFKSNPKNFFSGSIKNVSTLEHKISLLSHFKLDFTLLLNFDQSLASTSYEDFIQAIHNAIPFDYLILGKGAALGKNREGNETALPKLGEKLGFKTEYLQKLCNAGKEISSGRIRKLLEQGSLREAETLLGRPYSIYLSPPAFTLNAQGKNIQKLSFALHDLCPLPSGTYALKSLINGKTYPSIALVDSGNMGLYIHPQKEYPSLECVFLEKIDPIPDQEPLIEAKLREITQFIHNTAHGL